MSSKNKIVIKTHLVAFSLLIVCGLGYTQTVDDMRLAVRENRLNDAYNDAMVLAQKGNAEAQYLAGLFQITGINKTKIPSTGIYYMISSADGDYGLAQEYLGLMYLEGKETPRDTEKALRYLSRSAAKGLPKSMLTLGYMYLRGEGVSRNLATAKSWFDIVSQVGGADGAKWRDAARAGNDEIVRVKMETKPDPRTNPRLAKTNPTMTESQRAVISENTASATPTPDSSPSIQRLRSAFQRPLISPNDPRLACHEKIEANTQLNQLKEKISLSGLTDVPFQMLSNQSVPNPQELPLIALWAESLKKCFTESEAYRHRNYSRQQIDILETEDEQLFGQAIQLYSKKISFSKFNLNVAQIFRNSKAALEDLSDSQRQAAQRETAIAAAAREEQRTSEIRRQEESRRLEALRQSERTQIAALRKQWEAKCEYSRQNSYDEHLTSHRKNCEKISTPAAQLLCTIGIASGARNYAKSAYDACMSDAPTY